MDFQTQKARAFTVLSRHGLKRYRFTPPPFQLLWNLGIQVRPPHFMDFAAAAALFGAWFAVFWGTIMWAIVWFREGTSLLRGTATALCAGLCYGLFMAFVYRRERLKHNLPSWESLRDVPQDHASPTTALPR